MTIHPKPTRYGIRYQVLNARGNVLHVFHTEAQAIAWMNNETFA